ncbi:MAG: hypothetical protein F4223_00795 [Rhodobacteraceae bacterium]|nr:hypothetical protein [Gammaproteobacteria bacterium]MYF44970.1 hypothetical protein [Paracoccaceae bacterium]
MPEKVRKAKNGKTIYFQISAWYNEENDRIHITSGSKKGAKGFITTVNADPKSKRGHPNLFKKLAKFLREHDVPAPDIDGL